MNWFIIYKKKTEPFIYTPLPYGWLTDNFSGFIDDNSDTIFPEIHCHRRILKIICYMNGNQPNGQKHCQAPNITLETLYTLISGRSCLIEASAAAASTPSK